MNLTTWIPFWNSLDAVRRVHSDLEFASIVFFALLAFFDVLSHRSEDEKKEKTFGTIGLWFFGVAVLCELLAYPYGQRNDTLSESVIGSLDSKATHASEKAEAAETAAGRASNDATLASSVAGEASGKAKEASRKIGEVEKRADNVDSRLGMTQLLVSSRSILNAADFKEGVKSIAGKTVFVRSYVNDPEAFFLCTALVSSFKPEVNARDECGRVPPSTPPITNIAVFGPTDDEMKSLADVVFQAKIQGGVTSGPYGKVEHSPVNVVFVGTKPPFSMVLGPVRQSPKKTHRSTK